MRRAAVLVMLAGCGRLGFDDGTSVRIVVDAVAPVELAALHAQLAFTGLDPDALHAMPTALPAELVIALSDGGMIGATVTARDAQGRTFAATGGAMVFLNQEAEVAVTLGGELAATCFDGARDGNESDVDCGGSCAACGIGGGCMVAGDCGTAQCVTGACEPAAGPPGWVKLAPLAIPRLGLGAVLGSDGHIYAIGGGNTTDTVAFDAVEEYDAATDAWSTGPTLTTKRMRTAATVDLAGNIYAIGGGSPTTVMTAERLAPGAAQWATAPPLMVARRSGSAATGPDGTVFALGGNDGSGIDLADVEALGTAGWITRAAVPTVRTNLAASRMPDGRVVVIGGHDVGEIVFFTTVEAYDTVANTWATLPPINHARSDLASVTAPDGRVYAIGGFAGTGGLSFVEAYRGGAGWLDLPPTTSPRDAGAATIGPDGRIYVIGGRDPMGNAGPLVEAYGPHVTLDHASGAAGSAVVVTGDNFATAAAIEIRFDGVAIEAAVTNAAGSMTATLHVPTVAAGVHVIEIEDARSHYPVHAAFAVP